MQEHIDKINRIKELFTADHMAELEKICDVWRSQITDNPNTEFFYLGRRTVYQELKKMIETDVEKLKHEFKEHEDER